MENKRVEVKLPLAVDTIQDEKTKIFSSKIKLFKNAVGFGRTQEEAEKNLICSISCMFEYERENVINILKKEFSDIHTKPNIDLVPA